MNNLAIVTRFDLNAFPAHDVFGGVVAYFWTQKVAIMKTFTDMVNNMAKSPADNGWVTLSWSVGSDDPIISWVAINVDGDTKSAAFTQLPDLQPLVDLRVTSTLSAHAAALAPGAATYNSWWTVSVHSTVDMTNYITRVFEFLVADLKTLKMTEAVNVIFLHSPLPTIYAKHGPNIIGLDKSLTANSFVLQLEALLPSKKYEAVVSTKLGNATTTIEAYARASKQNTEYEYTNYANQAQNPLKYYGADNIKFLQTTAKKYDPKGFFQTVVPGGFKSSKV